MKYYLCKLELVKPFDQKTLSRSLSEFFNDEMNSDLFPVMFVEEELPPNRLFKRAIRAIGAALLKSFVAIDTKDQIKLFDDILNYCEKYEDHFKLTQINSIKELNNEEIKKSLVFFSSLGELKDFLDGKRTYI